VTINVRQTIALLLLSCGWIAISGMGCASGESKKSTKPSMIPSPPSKPSDAPSSRPPPSESSGRLTINDPCPKRLHDLCGPLLLYYAINQRLPDSIDELHRVPGFESVGPNTCPVSDKPYAYNPKGIRAPNVTSFAVIYDAEPTHAGYRWAIVVEEPQGNAALQAKVVAWAESRFPKTAAPATAPTP
jgi:hypothetical protein